MLTAGQGLDAERRFLGLCPWISIGSRQSFNISEDTIHQRLGHRGSTSSEQFEWELLSWKRMQSSIDWVYQLSAPVGYDAS